ncbi:MAG: hypothetical protein AAF394_04940 [Planctomycetota bacterium]
MQVEHLGAGKFQAGLRNGVENFIWRFTPDTLQPALKDVVDTAALQLISYDQAAILLQGMRYAVIDYESAPVHFEQVLRRAGVA